MYSAQQIADYFLYIAQEAGSYLSNLKLQKLLYYAQGWHLGLSGEPLFDERIEAWIHGPAVPPVYGNYKKFGWQPICEPKELPKLDQDTMTFLTDVCNVYMPKDAYELELMSHREQPWIKARGGIPDTDSSRAVISQESMREYFASVAQEA